MECGLTFEEDKLALTVLIHGVDLRRQPFPEVADLHGVSRHHRIITHPPEPLILMRKPLYGILMHDDALIKF